MKLERRSNEIVNRLNKTKEEKTIDYAAEKATRLAAEKKKRKDEGEKRRSEEEREKKQRDEEMEAKSYGSVFKHASMNTNKHSGPIDPKKYEEDFF